MKYYRRKEIDSTQRLGMAITAYLLIGCYGAMTDLAEHWNVSRLFIYRLIWKLGDIFSCQESHIENNIQQEKRLIDRYILACRLQGKSSLADISSILQIFDLRYDSIGYISQRIKQISLETPEETFQSNTTIRFLVSDEIFSGSKPILITIDARSLMILKIELLESRTGLDWFEHWKQLQKDGIRAEVIVGDNGSGLKKGCSLIGYTHHPDLFHILQELAWFNSYFEKQAYAALADLEKKYKLLGNAKSETVFLRRFVDYEEAEERFEELVAIYDNFHYLWITLKKAFDPFDPHTGVAKEVSMVKGEIESVLELMETIENEKLQGALKSVKNTLENYWDYFSEMESIYKGLGKRYHIDALNCITLAWQYEQKAKNCENYSAKKIFEKEMSDYLELAKSYDPSNFESLKHEAFKEFGNNLRSSSYIENINSTIRKYLNTSRGQITQETLNLIRFFLNRRIFKRGYRKGKTPIGIFNDKPLKSSWIDELLDIVY